MKGWCSESTSDSGHNQETRLVRPRDTVHSSEEVWSNSASHNWLALAAHKSLYNFEKGNNANSLHMSYPVEEHTVQQPEKFDRKDLTSMTKEALDVGDEDQKEKFEELPIAFEHLTEWLKGVLGDELKLTSKELMDIGDESRVRTIGQVDRKKSSAKVDVR